ncbi:MAG: response regulator [Chloroflexota bacterium]
MSPLIVVVDNSQAIRTMLALIAQSEGWTVSGHNYAEINFAVIQQLKPDLIILDFVEQQIGEGWELLQLLKMEESTAVIPIIISTTMPVLPLEMQGYLTSRDIQVIAKPFAVETFITLTRQALDRDSALPLSQIKCLPILLAEDNTELSSDFMMILQLEGYLATSVPNGQLALDAVRQGQYSVVFLDIQMPVMTGLEFIAAYTLEPGPHTPIVIFSGETNLRMETFPAFVMGRLAKPFEIDELLGFVSRYAVPVLNP